MHWFRSLVSIIIWVNWLCISIINTPYWQACFFTHLSFSIECITWCMHSSATVFFYGVSDSLLAKLQTIQNATVLVITGTRNFDHITPVLRDLHWLPVRQRISFKLAMMVYKCLHGLAPSYLVDVCTPVSSIVGRWQLRSANSGTLIVPGTRNTIGRRNFAVSGPATWNRLPVELWTSLLSIDAFATKLKTHLFSCEYFWRLLFIRRYTNGHIDWLIDWLIAPFWVGLCDFKNCWKLIILGLILMFIDSPFLILLFSWMDQCAWCNRYAIKDKMLRCWWCAVQFSESLVVYCLITNNAVKGSS